MKGTLCKHLFAVINSGMATFNDLSPIFRFHPLHVINNDLFHDNLVYNAHNTGEKETQNLPFLEKKCIQFGERVPTTADGSYFALEREGIGFQES